MTREEKLAFDQIVRTAMDKSVWIPSKTLDGRRRGTTRILTASVFFDVMREFMDKQRAMEAKRKRERK